jgi:hypothetical protein
MVCDLRTDKARLGVTAPKAYSVHRREVATRIRNGERGPWLERPAGACSMVPVIGTVDTAKPVGSVPGDAGTPNSKTGILP